jgi:cytochrome c-type biogenesis protein CcmE
MDPRAKRTTRLVVALGAAVLLAAALVYTSFSASSEATTPSKVVDAPADGRFYELTGEVMPGYSREGDVLRFRVRERAGRVSVPVRYRGVVPDPFRAGREVIVTVKREGRGFVAERDSLITKCPSKFSSDAEAS